MVEVICDTNFLIHLATRRIKNIDNLDVEIGSISFVVPEVVKNELVKLQEIPEKNQEVTIGDKILISGPTTGNQEIIVEKMFVNGSENILAKVGDKVTMPLPFRIRLSDKLYKIIS